MAVCGRFLKYYTQASGISDRSFKGMGTLVVRCSGISTVLLNHPICHVSPPVFLGKGLLNPNSMYVHTTVLNTMLATWLLPIVPPIVASASGAIVASVLPNPQHALWKIITSYILWGIGLPLAMVVLVIYFHRLTIHHLPTKEVIVSVFLPLGPLGQGGFAIMELGKMAMLVFPKTNTLPLGTTSNQLMHSGEILYVVGWLVATIMWGFGFVWLFFAFASITRRPFPFNMGWWGFTFPLGVYTTSTLQMAAELPSNFFKVVGTVRRPKQFKLLRVEANTYSYRVLQLQ
jgi:tellurite resistance protein TehA-like permease